MVMKSQTKSHKGTDKLLIYFRKNCGRLKTLITSENNVSMHFLTQLFGHR